MKKSNNKMLTMMRRLPSDCVYGKILSPVGELTLVASEKGLHAILWENEGYDKEMVEILNQLSQKPQQKHIQSAKKQLGEYFKGKRKDFDIPLVMDGTEFQKKAWRQLSKIPYGKTISYQQQAMALGDKNKVRAIGGANGRNPISIIVPCHRVVAKTGDLHGFGGGLDAKKYLLDLEQSQS